MLKMGSLPSNFAKQPNADERDDFNSNPVRCGWNFGRANGRPVGRASLAPRSVTLFGDVTHRYFMLRFYGAIAEEERRLISERTKATLTVKEGGWRPPRAARATSRSPASHA